MRSVNRATGKEEENGGGGKISSSLESKARDGEQMFHKYKEARKEEEASPPPRIHLAKVQGRTRDRQTAVIDSGDARKYMLCNS